LVEEVELGWRGKICVVSWEEVPYEGWLNRLEYERKS